MNNRFGCFLVSNRHHETRNNSSNYLTTPTPWKTRCSLKDPYWKKCYLRVQSDKCHSRAFVLLETDVCDVRIFSSDSRDHGTALWSQHDAMIYIFRETIFRLVLLNNCYEVTHLRFHHNLLLSYWFLLRLERKKIRRYFFFIEWLKSVIIINLPNCFSDDAKTQLLGLFSMMIVLKIEIKKLLEFNMIIMTVIASSSTCGL